ncbi:hypothetical protein [Cellulophaga omnivescoria]|uniref:hypothetical protein n=1 Tax=Cellulophaga omnivescoria TaxID=1888890 RepID=UPI0009866DDF|nr:hypothetical protein [Cellulophaga omnivescoria]WBU88472.1 hypothetical protein PBN93_11375 [Cellulophaga omnivescoria]WKB80451.1 hypothetical protein QYR09_11885 [Cellulophaga lytica]
MNLSEQLILCKKCENRKFDPNTGINCSLTGKKPNFEDTCSTFVLDAKEAEKIAAKGQASAYVKEDSKQNMWWVLGVVLIVIKIIWRFSRD